MKKIIYLLPFIFLFLSCDDDNNNEDAFISKDAQIYSFTLESDNEDQQSILKDVKFSIDQHKEYIYNFKHLPTDNRIFKINMTFSPQYPIKGAFIIYPDKTEKWNKSSIVDFSLKPQIKVVSQDGVSERIYTIEIR